MSSNAFTFEIPEARFDSLVNELRDAIKADCGTDYNDKTVRTAVVKWLNSRLDSLFEDAVERLTSPSFEEARDFARVLDELKEAPASMPARDHSTVEAPDVFNGN